MAIRNAPHVYLAKQNGNYFLFVCIPHAQGYKVELLSGGGQSLSDPILFSIEEDPSTSTTAEMKYYFYKFNLYSSEAISSRRTNMRNTGNTGPVRDIEDNASSNQVPNLENTLSVEVQNNIDTSGKSRYQTILMLEDADNGYGIDPQPGEVFLSSCPYLYLSNPSAETGGDDQKFTPSLINIGEYQNIEDPEIEVVFENLNIDQSYDVEIDNNGSIFPEYDRRNIIVPQPSAALRSTSSDSHFFRAKYRGNQKKATIPTRSSDRKPNSFLNETQVKVKEEFLKSMAEESKSQHKRIGNG